MSRRFYAYSVICLIMLAIIDGVMVAPLWGKSADDTQYHPPEVGISYLAGAIRG